MRILAQSPNARTDELLALFDNKPHESLACILGKEIAHIKNYERPELTVPEMLLLLSFTVKALSKELDITHERLSRLEARAGIDHTGQRNR